MKARRKSSPAVPKFDSVPGLPDNPDDSPATMDLITQIVLQSDGFLPKRVEHAFANAGFGIRRLMREECHSSVWVIWLTRRGINLAKDNQVASKQVRRALGQSGLKIGAGELTVLEQRADKLKCAFMYGPVPLG